MTTTNTRAHFTGIIQPLAFAVAAAFSAGYTHAADSFAEKPFYLQNETTTGTIAIKPNVMLFIDDSGSMTWVPGSNRTPTSGSGERSKLQITKSTLNALLEQYKDSMNWSLQTLHNNGNSDSNTKKSYTDGTANNDWVYMQGRVNQITARQGTPTTRRYYELSQLVREQTEYRCQKNYIVLMSDGDANSSYTANWQSTNNPSAPYEPILNTIRPLLGTVKDAYFGYKEGGTYEYLVTQLPSGGHSTDIWDTVWDRNDGLKWFSHTLAEKDFKTDGRDLAGKSWDGDDADPKEADGKTSIYKEQTVETFTVGFGSGISEAGETYLRRGASPKAGYFAADNEAQLVSAFNSIFSNIAAQTVVNPISSYGTVAPAVMSSAVPNMAASVHLDTSSWSSQLRFFDLDAQGNVSSTSYKQPSFNNRKTLINTGSRVLWADTASDLSNDEFAIAANADNSNADEWKNALLPWTTRSKADTDIKQEAETKKYSQSYRERSSNPDERNLGDIIDSPVSAIGNNVNGRQEFLVTAANDGMVHLFQSSSNTDHPYDLKLSYIPAGMERDGGNGGTTLGTTLKELAKEGYGQNAAQPHRYMVNGGFVLRQTPDSQYSKGQQIFMAGAMGQGGRGAYALNIGGQDRSSGNTLALSNGSDSSLLSDVPLFETPKGTDNTLGYTIGTPQIGRISTNRAPDSVALDKDVRYAVFLASGYRSRKAAIDNNETALYIYDALGQEARSGEKVSTSGNLLQKITVPGGVGGLSSPTLVDTDFDGVVDVAYAGDYGGNMYRFDFRGGKASGGSQTGNATPANWTVTRIYSGDSKQPITAAPAVSRRSAGKYVVIFGTGSDIYENDRNNTGSDIYENDRNNKASQAVYGIFDDVSQAPVAVNGKADSLLIQTVIDNGTTGYRYLSRRAITASHKGWRFDLPEAGERVVVKPTMILRTAMLTTRIYYSVTTETGTHGDVCLPSTSTTQTNSSSWLMSFNAETGGALTKRDAYLDFKQQLSADGTNYYANGQKQTGIISTTYTDVTRKSATTKDGDAGGNGTDDELNSNGRAPRNNCFSGGAQPLVTTGLNAVDSESTANASNLGNLAVVGPACEASVRRISWREIF